MKVIGTGSYLPEYIISNEHLAKVVDTSDEWIVERTGICERRISNGQENSHFAVNAARNALEDAKLQPNDIDMVVVATLSSEYFTPSIACIVQRELNISNAVCFDINAACSGFLYALNTVQCYMKAGMARNAIVIGSETLSKLVDYSDRSTCVLFGDAAGAVVVHNDESSFFYSELGADGNKSDALICRQLPLNNIAVQNELKRDYIHMNGHEVYKFVVKVIPDLIKRVIEKSGVSLDDYKYFLLHQANKRMNEKIAAKLGLDISKFPSNLEKTGNTSAASVPVLLDEINKQGKLNQGDKIILCAFGGGLTWSAIALEW